MVDITVSSEALTVTPFRGEKSAFPSNFGILFAKIKCVKQQRYT